MKAGAVLGCHMLLALAWSASLSAAPADLPRSRSCTLELQLQPTSGATQYGLATKYHFTDPAAVRLGFLIQFSTEDGTASSLREQGDSIFSISQTYRYNTESDQRSGSVFLHFVRYFKLADRFGLSLDAGPAFGWNWSKQTQANAPPDQTSIQSIRTSENSFKNYGLDLEAGFEWHFVRRLSLAGRYGLSFYRTEGHQTLSSDDYFPASNTHGRYNAVRSSDGFTVQTTNGVFSLIGYW